MKWFKRLLLRWDRYWLDRQRHKEIQRRRMEYIKLLDKLEPQEIRPKKRMTFIDSEFDGSLVIEEPIPVDWNEEMKQLLKEEL